MLLQVFLLVPHWRRKMGSWSAQSVTALGAGGGERLRRGEVRKFPFVGSRVHAELWRLSESFSSPPMRKGKATVHTPPRGPYSSRALHSGKLN
jgi:hypothetical protein